MTLNPMDPLGTGKDTIQYKNNTTNKKISFSGDNNNLEKTLAASGLFRRNKVQCYNSVSRYGYLPVHETEQVAREYLFFTKPDLNLFGDGSGKNLYEYEIGLNSKLLLYPFFVETNARNGDALRQLQSSVKDSNGRVNPFMYLLTNHVTSTLDLPTLTAESKESTSNIMGMNIQYRGHSLKSDAGYDFTISFTDTAYLEIYSLLKAYDEYIRLLKTGEIAPMKNHILYRILAEQFSIYKFLVSQDGETILYYAKLTGCYFTDVPRSDMADPPPDGFKYSVSLHAQFVEDSNPLIIQEFNRLSPGHKFNKYVDVYDYDNNVVDNTWVDWPKIVAYKDKRSRRRTGSYDYRLKWVRQED